MFFTPEFCSGNLCFVVCIGILKFTLVFWGLHWYFEAGWLRADMVGLCLFPLTINCRPTAMQCSHRQKRGSIVFCNFVFFFQVYCFFGIKYLNRPWYVNLRTNMPNLSNYSTSRRSLSIQLLYYSNSEIGTCIATVTTKCPLFKKTRLVLVQTLVLNKAQWA